jgi:transposase
MTDASRWVGIDLHRRRSHIAIVDEHGELTESRRIANDRGTFLELLSDPAGGETHVALEATYGWEWLAELLEEAGYDLHLAHPLRTRAIAAARVKTDAIDARTLAQLLRTGMLPEAYIAPRELRDLRELLRHRATLTRMRSAIKNRVHAILAKHGIIHQHSDLFGKGGRQFLATLELRDTPRRRLDSLIALIEDFDREIADTTREIEQRAREDDRVDVLCQIRGVGRYTALLIIAEIGDVTRFPTARHVCSWAGLAPTVRSSDGKARLGHISRQGSPALRWALVEPPRRSPPGPARCATSSNGSPSAAAARSPRSRSPARSSPCPTTAYATEKSVAWRAAAARTRKNSWRHEPRRTLTQHGLRPRPRRDAHARASSTVVMASLTTRRPPT